MMATLSSTIPAGEQWSYEVKWDGYRAMIVKERTRVRLMSRNLKDLTTDYPHIAAAAGNLTAKDAIVDGEIVALDAAGKPTFQALPHRSVKPVAIVFYAFDLLHLDGVDYRSRPLRERRRMLHQLSFALPILLSSPLPGTPKQIQGAIEREGLEGLVAKRTDSIYESGRRSRAWLKVKFSKRQEFVIGGYKPAGNSFDSVLVGYYEGRKFLYAGKVRAGFTAHTRTEVFARIAEPADTCPFANLPNSEGKSHWGEGITAEDMKSLRWVTPRAVIEVAFTEWTAGNNLRHASFVGVREDKSPRDVRRQA